MSSGTPVPRHRPRPPALLFGVPIADLTLSEAVDVIGELVAEGRRTGRTHQVSTVNVDFIVNALADHDVATILRRAELCIPDGMPVVWASRLLRMPVRERVAGADLVPLTIDVAQRTGWRIHIFGSRPDVATKAEHLLKSRYPGAVFSIDPGPVLHDPTEVDDDVLEAIAAVDADILFVALGNPKQERFIAAHRARLGVPVMVGVGGTLDMLVGHRRRAPTWMRSLGMEWVMRAVQEPGRLGARYARDIKEFTPAFARLWREHRSRSTRVGMTLTYDGDDVRARFEGDSLPDDRAWLAAIDALLTGAGLRIEGNQGHAPRDSALARAIGLIGVANRGGGAVKCDIAEHDLRAWAAEYSIDTTVFGGN